MMMTPNEYATKADMKQLELKLDKAVEDLAGIINRFAQHVDERFDIIESRLDNHALRLDKLEGQVGSLNKKYDRLTDLLQPLLASLK
jgi:uncharacterized protein involved in exopolysaccharide biosynthesis